MDTIVENPPSEVRKEENDNEEGQQLFDQMSMSDENPFENLDLSSEAIPAQEQSEEEESKSSEVMDFREMMKQSKKEKKKEKRKNKLKAAKHKEASQKENINTNIVSEKNTKKSKKMVMDSEDEKIEEEKQQIKENSSKKFKQRKNSESEENLSKASDESAEYSEEENPSSQSDNNKGDEIEKEGAGNNKEGRSSKKKLGKKSRMQRILQKEGFDLKELGNDGEANYELNESVNNSDDSFSSTGKKKKNNKKVKRDKKEKKPQLSNEEFLSKLKEIGCEDEIEENDSERYNYDSGIEELTKLKPKKETKNTIKVQNKLFGNLEMEIEQQINTQENNELPEGEIPTEKLELEFKPKTAASSRAGSFLSKVEALKKHRGLEADIDQAEFDKMAKEKAKRSIYQLVSKIQNEIEENEEIDIEIKAPAIAKGKSADLINNTMFIVKNLASKNMNTSTENIGTNEFDQQITALDKDSGENGAEIKNVEKKINIEQSSSFSFGIKKKPVSRSEFFKQIKESINVRRSKYVSAEELKNSFKPSKLEELEEIRQKREERRKKEAMYELGEVEDDDAENVIRELEDEVARHERISKDDLRRLLRQEEGMEELDEYEEEDDKKKNKKDKENEVDEKQKSSEENKIEKESTEKAAKPTISAEANNNIKNIEEKESASEHEQKHADDMIDEYDDDEQPIKQNVEEEEEEEMDVEEEDDEGYENENDEEEENELEEEEEGEDKKEDQEIEEEELEEKRYEDDIKKTEMLKELEEEGIIMPGVNNKRKNLSKIVDEEIDPLKYIIDGENNVQDSTSLLNEEKKEETPPLLSQEETLEFKEFKKLRKIAVVIQEKKKKREEQLKRAKEFFEQEAELGSDNEENDDNVKAINRKDDSEEEDGEELDQELKELIDNAVDINEEDEDLAFRKYMEDVKEKDREELQRILRGDFRRHNQDMPELQEMEEDEKNRYERMQKMMEWMRRREDDEKGLYADDSEDEDDEKNFYYDYNGNRKRINHKQKVTAEQHEEESQQENEQEVEQKLRYFLMDTISPAKNHSFQSKPSELLTELPEMFKKTNKPFNKPFAKFDLGLNKEENHKKINENEEEKKKKNFAGNLFSLGSSKGEANGLTKPKMKKTTSHMSEELNKNKVQKPMMGSIPQNKLNAIFSRFSKPTKK